jgi:hypothetical protein
MTWVLRLAPRSTWHWLFAIAASTALVIPCYLVGREIAGAKPVRGAFVPVTGVIWANRVFSDRRSLAVWLHYRGAAYTVWARRHRPASRVLERR